MLTTEGVSASESTSGTAGQETTTTATTSPPTTTAPPTTGPDDTTTIGTDTEPGSSTTAVSTSASSATSEGSTGDATSGTSEPVPSDTDEDGAADDVDNCPDLANPGQEDGDSDGLGDACDSCPAAENPGQEDGDADLLGDACDNCPADENPGQEDADADGQGDLCDDDDDGDGAPDGADNCPADANPGQEDADKDGQGDACDDDDDNDGDPDAMDNCPLIANADQKDGDGDGKGDVCDDDLDGDNIPNGDDPFPNDKNLPGVVVPFKMYAHSSGVLHTVDVTTYDTVQVGAFKFSNDGCDHSVTDVAIDRWGVLYGVTFGCAYVIHPQTATAYKLGSLPQSFNGLTLVPKGVIDPNKDTLIGISNAGGWFRLTLMNGVFQAQQLGTYGPGYSSAGDAFSIEGVGTYAAVNKQGVVNATVIVSVDPANGKVLGELATLNGYPTVYGLAGWEGLIVAFNSGGQLIKVDPMTKAVTLIGNKGVSWWGAGVGTVLPQ